jgi:ribosome maturation factor RimP
MISQAYIEQLVNEKLEGTSLFLVHLSVGASNKISIEIDGLTGVTIDDCVAVSRYVESNLDREQEDFELQVASPGVSKPLVDRRQYIKNIGREVKILTSEGEELKGILLAAGEEVLIKQPALKKKKLPERETALAWDQIRETKVLISFK